jgi:hypothetical protein
VGFSELSFCEVESMFVQFHLFSSMHRPLSKTVGEVSLSMHFFVEWKLASKHNWKISPWEQAKQGMVGMLFIYS